MSPSGATEGDSRGIQGQLSQPPALHVPDRTLTVELFLVQQIDENARIEIAAARAHDDAPGGRQFHAGVDRPPVLDRGDACLIPGALYAIRLQFLRYRKQIANYGAAVFQRS